MAERRSGIHTVLANPNLFELFQDLLRKPDSVETLVSTYIRPHPGCRLLDVGCGTGNLLSYLGNVDYLGIDRDERYICRARERFAGRGEFLLADARDLASQRHAPFDVVTMVGLLHHLDDEVARDLFTTVRGLLNARGRLVTVDPCFLDRQSPVARFLINADRGQNVRTAAQYGDLASGAFSDVELSVRSNLLRIPYDHAIMVCHV